MTPLAYHLSHIQTANRKELYKQKFVANPAASTECSCGSSCLFLPALEYLALEVFGINICHSKYCEKRADKELQVLAPLFQAYKVPSFDDTKPYVERKVKLSFDDHNAFQLCLRWLFEIGVRYETVGGTYDIVTDLTPLDWTEILYQTRK